MVGASHAMPSPLTSADKVTPTRCRDVVHNFEFESGLLSGKPCMHI